MEYKQLSLIEPRTGIIAKIFGVFLILLGLVMLPETTSNSAWRRKLRV